MDNKMGWASAVTLVAALAVAAPLFSGAASAQEPRKILFTSGRSGEGQVNLYLMDENGANVKPVTQGTGFSFDGSLSPDGKRIVYSYAANKEDKKAEIYVINTDGTGKTALTQSGLLCFSPVWSPDGKRIAYSSMVAPEPGKPPSMKLHLMDADGKNAAELGEGWASAWTPDGKRLVYTLFMGNDDNVSIQTVETTGANPQQLVGPKSALAIFSPDGKKIAYIAEGGGDQPDLFVADADGKNPVQLTKTPELEFGALWSADGKRIFFTRMPREGGDDQVKKMEIHATDLEGKSTEQLTANDSLDSLAGGFLIFSLLRGGG